ncbi:hypothetical protein HK405_002651, partial [Cladochytrium tenue]
MVNTGEGADVDDIPCRWGAAVTVDIQGIRWERYYPVSREEFRENRIINYGTRRDDPRGRDRVETRMNLNIPQDGILREVTRHRNDGEFYRFFYTRLRKKTRCYLNHPQLRNLLWATSKNDVYYA